MDNISEPKVKTHH